MELIALPSSKYRDNWFFRNRWYVYSTVHGVTCQKFLFLVEAVCFSVCPEYWDIMLSGYPEDTRSIFLRNDCGRLTHYTVSQPKLSHCGSQGCCLNWTATLHKNKFQVTGVRSPCWCWTTLTCAKEPVLTFDSFTT